VYNKWDVLMKPVDCLWNIFVKIFWRCFTFYNCQNKRLPYYQLKILFFFIIVSFRIYISKVFPFNLFISTFLFYPPFVEEINIIFLSIQLFVNKKRLNKFVIYSNFICFLKTVLLVIIFAITNVKDIILK